VDLSLLTDGLRAEREQGITIDVAYRYFSTPKRKFIIADAPGHEQYTRNMATAASTADLAIVLIDARHGVLSQSRRHAYIAILLGIPQIVVAVNKMDQVGYRQEVYDAIREEFGEYVARLRAGQAAGAESRPDSVPALPFFIPISALEGENVVRRSQLMPWFTGPSLLEYLETVPSAVLSDSRGLRFPVQYVIRSGDFRGFAGQIASGALRPGDPVMVLPSGRTSSVQSIVTWDGELPEAAAPLSITVSLKDEIDISRGDMLVSPSSPPTVSGAMETTLVWMSEQPLRAGRPYLLKHAAQTIRARVREDLRRIDMGSLAEEPATALALNEIGRAVVVTERPLFFDPYQVNRKTGSLILVDPITNETVSAGMITGAASVSSSQDFVTEKERLARNGHRPAVVALESEQAAASLERELFNAGRQVVWLGQELPAEFVPTLVLSFYKAGFIVITTLVVDAEGWPMEIISFSYEECQDTRGLADAVVRRTNLR
jgi:sulfate adenylyltransferase large subunit